MDVFETIHSRRSIRNYTQEEVSSEHLETILRAAMSAPSAGNAQPWQFVVVKDKARLNRVAEIHPHAGMAPRAPMGILVCGDVSKERFPGYWAQDCSAAIQNMLLAVQGLGLGAVWTGIHPAAEREAAFKAEFKLPDHVIPLAFIVIGHPDQALARMDRYQPERIHNEIWQGSAES